MMLLGGSQNNGGNVLNFISNLFFDGDLCETVSFLQQQGEYDFSENHSHLFLPFLSGYFEM